MSDSRIATAVRKAILQVSAIAEERIHVEVQNAVAILRGELDDWHLRNTIEEAVSRVPHVAIVVNDILLKQPTMPFQTHASLAMP